MAVKSLSVKIHWSLAKNTSCASADGIGWVVMALPSCPVVCLLGNHPAHAAARIRLVAVISRDEMDVQVRHCLAGSGIIVDADVVAIGLVLLGNQFFTRSRRANSAARSTSVTSKNEPIWRLGITKLCPGDTG